ncbi:MAG: hypothetical protein LBR42_00345, partial [Candidatus Methanoplasma sp.]|nr:hypothetical protein [Candidatus Methanoplasma sp.]
MTKQTHFRTSELRPNKNISVPIWNIILAEAFFDRFGLYDTVKGLKTKGIDRRRIAELMVAYKVGDSFSILKCHEFSMQEPVRRHAGIPVFDVKTMYRAVDTLGENREQTMDHFRKTFLRMYGQEITDTTFDRTSLIYFG